MWRLLPLLSLACAPDAPVGTPQPPAPPTTARCARQADNALRIDCTVPLGAPAPLDLRVLDARGLTVTARSLPAADLHQVTFWGLQPETAYAVRGTVPGQPSWEEPVETGPLPPVVQFDAALTGTPTPEALLLPFQCGGSGRLVVMRPTDGEVLWYQEVGAGLDLPNFVKVEGFGLDSASGRIQVLYGHHGLRELLWSGEVVQHVPRSSLPRPLHHDVLRVGPHLLALQADAHDEPDGSYVLDGVYVLDEGGEVVAEWDLRDHLAPTGGGPGSGYWTIEFPGAVDYTHANSLYVDDNGDWYLSFRLLDTVLKVRGALDAPDFGEILWALAPTDRGLLGNDLTVASTNGATDVLDFERQHHANLDEQGRLLLFDNRDAAEASRVLRIRIDEGAGVADIEEAWGLDVHCPVQGSATPLPNGHVLATCPTLQRIVELAPGQPEPVWEATLTCRASGERPLLMRAIPVTL